MTTGKSVSEGLIHLLSYCGLTDAKMRASEKDLPVLEHEAAHSDKLQTANFFLIAKQNLTERNKFDF